MAGETIFQSNILINFLYPFLLIFFIGFAILEKIKVFGEDKKQINALVSLIIALFFMGVASSTKVLLGNLILFLSISLIILFIIFLLLGFIASGSDNKQFSLSKPLVIFFGAVVLIALVISILAVLGVLGESLKDFTSFFSGISSSFWTNLIIIVLVAIALAAVLKSPVSPKPK